ncbi:hypothetical protein BU23DRAFT_578010 [Bimuria novae-zelandiae CBS 107.79]|uniref:Uncharacterized protein n=1 Tax=Bimuria novae-zelandiae CBS 107.79 TaxID=1447943 RepID=A0A6A5VIP0_9PLEO|nr:hypothetical protein BU23DRAFT_578010 [Bimuria novae-zelandiae CBS 107.79]
MTRESTLPCNDDGQYTDSRDPTYNHWRKHSTFYALSITTTLASLLLISERNKWRASGIDFQMAIQYPVSAAFVTQLLAALFGVIHMAAICKMINYALRLRLWRASVSLDVLRTWVDMKIPRVDWDLPLRFFFPVLFMVFLSLVPAALWAGSFAPLLSTTPISMSVKIPAYENISMTKEYPMEIGNDGPSIRSSKGLFTYSVGQKLIAPLLSTAAAASSNFTASLVHPKIDNTRFSYTGRSYGVGSSVGLSDFAIGYFANVMCIYNTTSNFTLSPVDDWIYAAAGTLPDSVGGPEYSSYIGHDSKAIVAMGVAHSELSPRRYVAITVGESYAHLNNTQCELDFRPWLFAVHLLGQAFNSSIDAYSMVMGGSWPPLTQEERNLGGLTNSITAMADDMPAAYAAAQLMVGGYYNVDFSTTFDITAQVLVPAMQFGQPVFIYAIFALNTIILIVLFFESTRTDAWRGLTRFDYLDPRDLIVAASRGGVRLAKAADETVGQNDAKIPKRNGRLVVGMGRDEGGHAAIELDEERSEGLMGEGWVSYAGVGVDEEKARVREALGRKAKGRVGMFGSFKRTVKA